MNSVFYKVHVKYIRETSSNEDLTLPIFCRKAEAASPESQGAQGREAPFASSERGEKTGDSSR